MLQKLTTLGIFPGVGTLPAGHENRLFSGKRPLRHASPLYSLQRALSGRMTRVEKNGSFFAKQPLGISLFVLLSEVLTGCSLCAYNEKRNGGKSFLERLLVTGSLNGSGMPFFFLVSSRHFFILVQYPVLHQQSSLRPRGVALPVVKKFGTSHCASPALRASLVMAPPAGPVMPKRGGATRRGSLPLLSFFPSDLLPETDIQTARLLLP